MLAEKHNRLQFSGHETFQCRSLWLKKGYDFVKAGHSFNDDYAVVELGVGKNMVNAIRFWMRAFGLTNPDTDQPTTLADKLLNDEDGWDPYLEDLGTLWLLHFHLIHTDRASLYNLIFNDFRRNKVEFAQSNFALFARRKAEEYTISFNDGTVRTDFEVFTRMYLRADTQGKDRDEGLTGLLTDLNLVRTFTRTNKDTNGKDTQVTYYTIENTEKPHLPDAILLYGIIESGQFDKSVSFDTLHTAPGQVGSIFALNATGLYTKLERIADDRDNEAVFSDQDGIKELSFRTKPDPMDILSRYYGR
ncbi:DUF4007 family protein [Fibrella sp. USSR17]